MINLRYTTLSYKNKKRIERPESEYLRFENTHEPLITKADSLICCLPHPIPTVHKMSLWECA
ncbi:MAG: hypothetical protein ACOY35_11520 [Bacillota bacterium]